MFQFYKKVGLFSTCATPQSRPIHVESRPHYFRNRPIMEYKILVIYIKLFYLSSQEQNFSRYVVLFKNEILIL